VSQSSFLDAIDQVTLLFQRTSQLSRYHFGFFCKLGPFSKYGRTTIFRIAKSRSPEAVLKCFALHLCLSRRKRSLKRLAGAKAIQSF